MDMHLQHGEVTVVGGSIQGRVSNAALAQVGKNPSTACAFTVQEA